MRRLFALLTAILCFAACNQAKPADELVCDEYGVVQRVNPELRTVYLVFTGHFSENDNGEFENFDGIVPVLDTLESRGVRGSFFPTGNCFRQPKYEDAIKRIISEGHYLSAHSNRHLLLCPYDHRDSTLVSADSLRNDIAGMEAELERFGLEKSQFDWMIPPYEWYNFETADGLHSLGYSLCNPTEGLVTGADWMPYGADNYCSAAQMVRNIWDFDDRYGLNGAIILVHAMVYPGREPEDRTYTHLGEIIDGLRDRGYDFGTFAEVSRQQF